MIKKNMKSFTGKMKKITLGKLFYNNKFVMVFSVIMSFIVWIVVSSSKSESVPVSISDIPVDINLSESAVQDGLKIFSGQDITARVDISGNRLVVGQVTKNDIQISAPQAASTIMSPGNYTLELSAKKVGLLQDYQIVSAVKPSVVTVMVDRYREAEFNIEPEINFTPKSDYFVGNTILSSQKVKLSGPETEISKIKKVKVKADIPGEISSTATLKLPIIMYDAYDKPITSETISCSVDEVDASVPVLMKKKIDIIPQFDNIPTGINLNREYKDIVKLNPSTLEIAGPEETVKSLSSVKLDSINFRDISLQNNNFNMPINLPQGCRSLNNEYSSTVSLNLSQFKEKNFNINQFSFKNVPAGKEASVYNGEINVTVLGPSNKLNSLKASDLSAEIVFNQDKEISNSMEMPVKITIKNHNSLWVYGTYYVNVNLEK
ncbi:MAG: CdaR family protein [Clostridia bacterium]|nr:CdaR family protein [Clostridia bacterium]